jgi:3-deoxy-7-phosphoheptulonate synthase
MADILPLAQRRALSNAPLDDVRIREVRGLITPELLVRELPTTMTTRATVNTARAAIHAVLEARDDRLVCVVGPCSIHDAQAAYEYAQRLAALMPSLADALVVVMRVYFEKPRTTLGWKGFINDPKLDGSFHMNVGLRAARRLLLNINELGVPAATEFLDLLSPQYIVDLIAWGAIGARTTESQTHRQLASGLSCAVGFKNGTDGSVQIAADAVKAANAPHTFMGMTKQGEAAIFFTDGNPDCHIILRGGKTPNYDAASVDAAAQVLEKSQLSPRIMIDFSHANSAKQYERQIAVASEVADQIAQGDERIVGVMIESHLHAGKQDLVPGQPLQYGVSITDGCIDWNATVDVLGQLANAVRARRTKIAKGQ